MAITNDNQNLNAAFAALRKDDAPTNLKASFIKHSSNISDQRFQTSVNLEVDNLIKLLLLKKELHQSKTATTLNELIHEVYQIVFGTDTITDEQVKQVYTELPARIQHIVDQNK